MQNLKNPEKRKECPIHIYKQIKYTPRTQIISNKIYLNIPKYLTNVSRKWYSGAQSFLYDFLCDFQDFELEMGKKTVNINSQEPSSN